MTAIDDLFAGMGKIHCNAIPDAGLHLARAPIRGAGMAHDHSWLKDLIHVAAPVAAQQG